MHLRSQVYWLSAFVLGEIGAGAFRYWPVWNKWPVFVGLLVLAILATLGFSLLHWTNSTSLDEAVVRRIGAIAVAFLLIANSFVIVWINYCVHDAQPHCWVAVSRGLHHQVGLVAILVASISFSRLCINLVTLGLLAAQSLPLFLAATDPKTTFTTDTYLGLMSPAMDLGQQVPKFFLLVAAALLANVHVTNRKKRMNIA